MNAHALTAIETREPPVTVGACLCGTVHYAVDRPLETLSHYNDPTSVTQGGAEWSDFLSAPLVAFRWLSGEEWLTSYDSANGTRRAFCRWCGSSMPMTTRDKAAMLLPVASLEAPATTAGLAAAVPA